MRGPSSSWYKEMGEILNREHDAIEREHWVKCHTPPETCPVLPGDTLIKREGVDL